MAGWESRDTLLHQDHVEEGAWLRSSQLAVRELEQASPERHSDQGTITHFVPVLLAIVVVATGCILSFVVFW